LDGSTAPDHPADPAPANPINAKTGRLPTGPFPPGFTPIVLPEKLDRRGWFRPHRAVTPVKAVRFEGPENEELARLIEAKAQFERVRINSLLLRLLRRGLEAERRTH